MVSYIEIPDYPYYFAGSDGGIYSCKGLGSARDSYELPKRKLKGGLGSSKYSQVVFCNKLGRRTRMVHSLIAECFLGERQENMTVSHLNGNRLDNRVENLKYETYSENLSRKVLHGTDDRGYNNSRSLVSKDQLWEIRRLLAENKLTHKEIGRKFGVSRSFITKINTGYRYKNST